MTIRSFSEKMEELKKKKSLIITKKYRLKKDTIYHAGKIHTILREGEECSYIPNSGIYTFKPRQIKGQAVSPVLSSDVVEESHEFFEEIV